MPKTRRLRWTTGGVGETEAQASPSFAQIAVVEESGGSPGPSFGQSPEGLSFTHLADALGLLEYPPRYLIGVVALVCDAVLLRRHDKDTAPLEVTADRSEAKKCARGGRPIELYYWPTPYGWKISIMLEECELPYVVHPVDISKGEQFAPHFLAISPNNRIPAIVDLCGPGGRPISVFESGAILQYLGRKTGKFYPRAERARVAVDEWLFWQMGGFGPMAGQANHFRRYAPEPVAYAISRYTDEVNPSVRRREHEADGA